MTVFMIRGQLAEGIHSSWNGAFTQFSHTVQCIEAIEFKEIYDMLYTLQMCGQCCSLLGQRQIQLMYVLWVLPATI